MSNSQILTFFLVVLWIQDSVEDLISIRANTSSVSPGEPYSITCQTRYHTIWLLKDTTYIVRETCQFDPKVNRKEYRCSTVEYDRTGHTLKLTVLKVEDHPSTVPWSCVHFPKNGNSYSKSLNITVINALPRTTPLSTTTTTPGQSSPVEAENMNHILIAICSAVGVMLVFTTLIVVLYVYIKRKQTHVEQGPTRREQSKEFLDEYDNYAVVSQPPLKYDWTMQSFGAAQTEDVPESINPNFDASKVYGVVFKSDPKGVKQIESFYGEEEAGPSNPNFDSDKVYGVVIKK